MGELQGTGTRRHFDTGFEVCGFRGATSTPGPGNHIALPQPSPSFHPRPASGTLPLVQELLFCRNLTGSQEPTELLCIEPLPRPGPHRGEVALS